MRDAHAGVQQRLGRLGLHVANSAQQVLGQERLRREAQRLGLAEPPRVRLRTCNTV